MSTVLSSEEIYTEYRTKVFSYIRSRITNYYDAEDLCEDVFVKIYQKLDSFDDKKASLSTWIYNITKNTVIDFYRSHKNELELKEEMFIVEEDEEIDEDMLEQLSKALNDLDEELKDIIVLRYYHGYNLTEIAQKMNLSYGVTKLRHKEALSVLNRKLEKYR